MMIGIEKLHRSFSAFIVRALTPKQAKLNLDILLGCSELEIFYDLAKLVFTFMCTVATLY